MTIIDDRLFRIEAQIQEIVEGCAGILFPGDRFSDLVARRLTETIRDNLQVLPSGGFAAPNRLVLLVSPSEFEIFNNDRWLRELESALRVVGQQLKVRFPDGKFLRVEARSQLNCADVLILSDASPNIISETSGMLAEGEPGNGHLPGAFLIVDGMSVFPIEQTITNIGRRPDNHLIIDDGRVSRTHAQLRFIHDEFVIFDLDSRGGTFVNGVRVSQSNLQAGDVISLAGVPIVFGLETSAVGETQDFTLFE
jgi:hypothetical protein